MDARRTRQKWCDNQAANVYNSTSEKHLFARSAYRGATAARQKRSPTKFFFMGHLVNYGTPGERVVQAQLDSQSRAQRFYERQMQDRLSEKMVDLIRRQEMMFVATADAHGNCDCSPRFGKAGFILILDDKTLAYPEYRGNGVFATLGNIKENSHVGLVFVDFFNTTVGLHVNGAAESHPSTKLPPILAAYLDRESPSLDSTVECWVMVVVDEAYIHCSKHVPLLEKKDKQIMWGTDDMSAKSDDYFQSSPKPVE